MIWTPLRVLDTSISLSLTRHVLLGRLFTLLPSHWSLKRPFVCNVSVQISIQKSGYDNESKRIQESVLIATMSRTSDGRTHTTRIPSRRMHIIPSKKYIRLFFHWYYAQEGQDIPIISERGSPHPVEFTSVVHFLDLMWLSVAHLILWDESTPASAQRCHRTRLGLLFTSSP